MNKILLYGMAILLLAGCASTDEDPGSGIVEEAKIPLPELIAKMKAANDPRGICRNASSYVLRQQMEKEGDETDQQYEVEIKFQKKPYFSKTTVFSNGKPQSISLFDGTSAWSINPVDGANTPLHGAKLKMLRSLGKIGNPAYSYRDIFDKIELAELVNGTQEYYRLTCLTEDNEIPPLIIFVDKNNYLTRKVALNFKSAAGEVINYTSFINRYSMMSGIMMPEVMTVNINDTKFQYKTVEFKLDVKFPPNEFKLPIPWYINAKPRDEALAAPTPTPTPTPAPAVPKK